MKKYLLYLIFTSICLLPSLALGTESKCIEGDCRSGQGTLTFSHGGKYVGEYYNGTMHGQGTLILSNGGKYVGEFEEGQFHGQGTFLFSNGSKYVGNGKLEKNTVEGLKK